MIRRRKTDTNARHWWSLAQSKAAV
jgi:hypothetical protein